ncbi:hypothetical protein GPAL_2028 [Glaciecola pallidula DSM 14239 = ACAM 615]|jgi:hypothetical protein|uniref:Uncharacterized protein n=2 Tax=Brumicola TaxID=3160924 RepID=K6Y809_9ALTE|nr:hypothetical protein GPAL_2028 [Glaciecola pallidula DSM 14239 = ACAM 615]
MNKLSASTSEKTKGMKSSIFVASTFIWIGMMIFIDKGILYGWFASDMQINLLIAFDTILGIVVIFMFMSLLKSMDELQRKIQFDALAFSMGTTFVASITYSLLTTAQIVRDSETSDLILIMTFCYMASVIYGQVKYR